LTPAESAAVQAVNNFHNAGAAAFGSGYDTSGLSSTAVGAAHRAMVCRSRVDQSKKASTVYDSFSAPNPTVRITGPTAATVSEMVTESETTYYPDRSVPYTPAPFTETYSLVYRGGSWLVNYYWPSSQGDSAGASVDASHCP
jgi:hypothetical protein